VNLPRLPRPSKQPKRHQGFSLIELLVVIAVLAIVLGFAVPNMRQMVLNNRTKAAINTLINGLHMARNEAVTRNKTITFCSSNQQGNNCGTKIAETAYQYGALVMEKGSSKVIHRTEPPPKNVVVKGDSKIDFQSSGAVNSGGTIKVLESSIKKTICIGVFGQTDTEEGDIKCP